MSFRHGCGVKEAEFMEVTNNSAQGIHVGVYPHFGVYPQHFGKYDKLIGPWESQL